MGRDRVLYDGECGLCRCCVLWLQRHDHDGRFALVPYQDVEATQAERDRFGRALHVLWPSGRANAGGDAVSSILVALGWWWVRPLRYPPLRWVAGLGYELVARHRGRIGRLLRLGECRPA